MLFSFRISSDRGATLREVQSYMSRACNYTIGLARINYGLSPVSSKINTRARYLCAATKCKENVIYVLIR